VSSAQAKHLLFVYGSLKRGFSNHRLILHAAFVGDCRTERRYRLLVFGSYPALSADGEQEIHGELYLVDEATLADLDVFEGEAYCRSSVALADGRTAQAYLLVPELLEHAVLAPQNRWL
jgi:gamma-glutamylaminecyclotransferase